MSAAAAPRPDWRSRPEGGGRFALWLIRTFAQRFGRRLARIVLLPITLYFLLRRGPERRASLAFLSRVAGRPATWWDSARHIHAFASTILDRVFLLGGAFKGFDVAVDGLDDLHAQMDLGRGVLLLGSHLGSFEVLRVLSLKRPDVTVRVVLDVRHNPAITSLLAELNPAVAATVIDAGQDGMAIVMQIKEALDAGALVTLLADRAAPGEPSVHVPFFGEPAPFPRAPWQIALSLGVPVALCFGLYLGGNRYRLVFERLTDGLVLARKDRESGIRDMVGRYAARLEAQARAHPRNWFNFYDFWQAPRPDPAGRTGEP